MLVNNLKIQSLTLVHGRIIVLYTDRQAVVVIKVFLLSWCDPATSVVNIPPSMHIITVLEPGLGMRDGGCYDADPPPPPPT